MTTIICKEEDGKIKVVADKLIVWWFWMKEYSTKIFHSNELLKNNINFPNLRCYWKMITKLFSS